MDDENRQRLVQAGCLVLVAIMAVGIAFSSNAPGWTSAAASLGTLLVASVAARTGLRQLRQVRDDSEARSRPMVAAEFRRVPYSPGSQSLVIRNYGPTVARNVLVTFEPPLPDPDPKVAHRSVTPALKARYARAIPTLTPGVELENLWLSGVAGPDDKFVNFEPLPDQVTVHIKSESDRGKTYEESFRLDADVQMKHTYAMGSNHPDKLREQATDHLETIAKALEGRNRRRSGNLPPPLPPDILA